jgi:hypothetical protein
MKVRAQQLLEGFDRLSRDDRQEVAREILRRAADFESPPLSDEKLVQQAEELSLKLDQAEAPDGEEP